MTKRKLEPKVTRQSLLNVVQESEALSTIQPEQAAAQNAIHACLVSYDQLSNSISPESKSNLAGIWEQCWKYQDTNELVRMTLAQMLVLFQSSWKRLFDKEAAGEKYMKELADRLASAPGNGEDPNILKTLIEVERSRLNDDRLLENKLINNTASIVLNLAKEYRSCKTSQAFWFHISQIQQFAGVVTAVLHQHIHDAGLLLKITNQLNEHAVKIFMQPVNQE